MSRPARPCAAFDQALAGLRHASELNSAELERMRQLSDRVETFSAGSQIETPRRNDRLRLIIAGWAYEARLLPDGRRQIFSYLLPSDLISSRHGSRSTRSSLLALTRVDCVDIPPALMAQAEGRPTGLGEGLTRALERQEQRSYEALLRLGQYTAQERVAHLLVELRDRLMRVGLAARDTFRSPLTQEHLADTLGLSVIHVNRVLRQLRTEGLLTVKFGVVTFLQPDRLELMASGGAAG